MIAPEKGVTVKDISLTRRQAQVLAPLLYHSPGLVLLEQTWSRTGGTHLYVTVAGKEMYHLSKRGNLKALAR